MNSKISRIARRVADSLDSETDLKRQRELEKKTKDTLRKTQDDLGRKMDDLVKKGVSGDDITKAVGEMEREFKDLERESKVR